MGGRQVGGREQAGARKDGLKPTSSWRPLALAAWCPQAPGPLPWAGAHTWAGCCGAGGGPRGAGIRVRLAPAPETRQPVRDRAPGRQRWRPHPSLHPRETLRGCCAGNHRQGILGSVVRVAQLTRGGTTAHRNERGIVPHPL